jgi:hypothetical protein
MRISFSLIIILVIYVLFSIIFNRYVLRLRGPAQLPAFTLRSLREQVDVIGDWVRSIDYYGRAQGSISSSHQWGTGAGNRRRARVPQRGGVRLTREDEAEEREQLVSSSRPTSPRGQSSGEGQPGGAIRL